MTTLFFFKVPKGDGNCFQKQQRQILDLPNTTWLSRSAFSYRPLVTEVPLLS